MSAEFPTAREILEAEAKAQRRDVQDIAHDDTIGVTMKRLFRLGSKHLFLVPKQTKIFFDQGTSQSQNDDLGIPYVKTAAETSLGQGRKTPNKQAMAIEAISLVRRGVRVLADSTSFGTIGALAGIPEFVAFRRGEIELIDRAGLILPFEMGGHPGFLEDVLDTIRSRAVLTPLFGRKVQGDPIRADRVPCGDASTGLRAAGSPENFNKYKLPIGIIWRPENASADSEFAFELDIPKPFLVAVNAPAVAFNTGTEPSYVDIETCMVDLTLRVIGRAMAPTSGNAG